MKADEKWWRGHAWDSAWEQDKALAPNRPTKWLVNVIMGKHADMMDAYPEPVILPREKSDEQEARMLTSVLPVILEQNRFDEVYARQAWEKNKHGTACYAVYWDSKKHNGLGDVSIRGIDLMNLFWEPGVEDIQDSQNVFLVSAQDREALKRRYPQLRSANLQADFSLTQYQTEDMNGKSDKALVVDWYYHTWRNGQRQLQYCKYCGLEVLYASEDDPLISDTGWYADGEYPFVLDPLFPQKESPAGWGYIDLGRETQENIDLLDHVISVNARAGAIPRYFRKNDSAINLEEFLDFSNPVVNVEGGLGEADMKPIQRYTLDGVYIQHLNNKIEELKQTCGNQDVTNGITSGVQRHRGADGGGGPHQPGCQQGHLPGVQQDSGKGDRAGAAVLQRAPNLPHPGARRGVAVCAVRQYRPDHAAEPVPVRAEPRLEKARVRYSGERPEAERVQQNGPERTGAAIAERRGIQSPDGGSERGAFKHDGFQQKGRADGNRAEQRRQGQEHGPLAENGPGPRRPVRAGHRRPHGQGPADRRRQGSAQSPRQRQYRRHRRGGGIAPDDRFKRARQEREPA